jgi:hypothetical protein
MAKRTRKNEAEQPALRLVQAECNQSEALAPLTPREWHLLDVLARLTARVRELEKAEGGTKPKH